MKQTTIPFAGFYCSIHDQELDIALERMFSDRATGCRVNTDLQNRAYSECKWQGVHEAYARYYCEAFARKFKIELTFDELVSPREYNFETDRIFATISEREARRVLALTDRALLDKHAAQRFTSRSGFMSYYSPDVGDWGDIGEWDINQIGTLMMAYAEQVADNGRDGFDMWEEHSLMQSASENGYLDNWLCEAGLTRLANIHDYLQTREERAQ